MERSRLAGAAVAGAFRRRAYSTATPRERLKALKSLRDFMPAAAPSAAGGEAEVTAHPYLSSAQLDGRGQSVYVETYGCQMNVADTEVVHAVLQGSGYARTAALEDADVVLLNTCAIRDNAEAKVWARLREIRAARRKGAAGWRARGEPSAPRGPTVGLLGCMGERLKGELLEGERLVDVVCGPDAYRSLPRLLAQAEAGQPGLDVALSLEETYADVAPVREATDGISAFVSIMRGCNNMCSYCIVPFTRGRERSRPAGSIAAEVAALAADGFKEVTLLGQNVNSYADVGHDGAAPAPALRDGFVAKSTQPRGTLRFAGLLRQLAEAHPEVRFRFTSPHPKDFPDGLLEAIAELPNACSQLHIPAQSGSSAVLDAMRRGYSRETYDALIGRVRELLPAASISSDFISGFCGETEADHEATLDLLRATRFDKAFMFAYSMREKTHAHRKLADDVDERTKHRRLREVIDVFSEGARASNEEEVGRTHLVLVEGTSKKSSAEWAGRTDTNKRVVFERRPVADGAASREVELRPGDYAAVRVGEAISANTLRAVPLARSSIGEFAARQSYA